MSTQTMVKPSTLSEALMLEVRAEAGRRGLSQVALGRLLGRSGQSVSDRFNGRTPWTVDETGELETVFGMPAGSLYAAAVSAVHGGGNPPKGRYAPAAGRKGWALAA